MDLQANRDKLYDYAKSSSINGKITMQENADLIMFYCITVYKDNVYYIQSIDAYAIATFKDDAMCLLDVYCKYQFNLEDVVEALSNNINYVTLGFTPNDCSSYEAKLIDEIAKDEALFTLNDNSEIFNKDKLMFPLLSHA